MYQQILVCTDGSPGSDRACEYAAWLAGRLGAGVHALYITDVRILEGPLMADIAGAFGAQPYPGLMPRLQEIQREKAATVLAAAQQRCQAAGATCRVTHETGPLLRVMLDHEKKADLVVIGQRGEHAAWTADVLGSSVERLVRGSIKPCLVTPQTFGPVDHLLIPYDGSHGAKKALQTGLELAGVLKAPVTILTACQRETEEAASRTLREARAEASSRGATVSAQLVHGEPDTAIIETTATVKANLIVMGAYGHTRIREWILGSTTSQVLRKSSVPVLLTRQ